MPLMQCPNACVCTEPPPAHPCVLHSGGVLFAVNCYGAACGTACDFSCAHMSISATPCNAPSGAFHGCLSGGPSWTGSGADGSGHTATFSATTSEHTDGSGCKYYRVDTLTVTYLGVTTTWQFYASLPPEFDDRERAGYLVNDGDTGCGYCQLFGTPTVYFDTLLYDNLPAAVDITVSGCTGDCCSQFNDSYTLDHRTTDGGSTGYCGGSNTTGARWSTSGVRESTSEAMYCIATPPGGGPAQPLYGQLIVSVGKFHDCDIYAGVRATAEGSVFTPDVVLLWSKAICPTCGGADIDLSDLDGPVIAYPYGASPDAFCDMEGMTIAGTIDLTP